MAAQLPPRFLWEARLGTRAAQAPSSGLRWAAGRRTWGWRRPRVQGAALWGLQRGVLLPPLPPIGLHLVRLARAPTRPVRTLPPGLLPARETSSRR